MPSVEPTLKRLTAPSIHLDVFAALVVLAAAYALVDPQLRLGSRWLFAAVMLVLTIGIVVSRRMGRHDWAHSMGFVLHCVATIAVAGSVAILGQRVLGGHDVDAKNLLRDAALLWMANILVFSLWYWHLDGGGPSARHMQGYTPTDFVFPQSALGDDCPEGWCPHYIDYLFVSFNTSSAFSPTDTMALSARVKVLMMLQSVISLVALAVLGARAINTLR